MVVPTQDEESSVHSPTRLPGAEQESMWTDNGGEFTSKAVQNYLQEQGVEQELTVPHTPERNGVAEWSNRTLIERARTQLIGTGYQLNFGRNL